MVLRYKGTYISCIVQESSSLETRTRSDLNVRRKLKRGVLSTNRLQMGALNKREALI